MADGRAVNGAVTSLGSLFPPVEAHKAAKRVGEAISERRGQLRRLHSFASDNAALVNLVRSLPNETSHDVMVPFGAAAFFPGRLIHTNEFMVLLGENYYAERTAKQTVEILQRRGKTLETQMDSLKAALMDLEAEAKFFTSTAAEAAEGLVEIREEYSEQSQINDSEPGESNSDPLGSSNTHDSCKSDKDDEYNQIMAKLDELEKEELEAESASGSDNYEDDVIDDKAKVERDVQADYCFSTSENNHENLERVNDVSLAAKRVTVGSERHLDTQSCIRDPILQTPVASIPVRHENEEFILEQKMTSMPSAPKHSDSNFEGSSHIASNQNLTTASSVRKAFTGSIVEHDHVFPSIQSTKTTATTQVLGSSSSKPVSRFKLQKGSR